MNKECGGKSGSNDISCPVRLMVVGAGNRGKVYSNFALDEPSRAKLVAVVDPNIARLQLLSNQHDISQAARYTTIPKENDFIWSSMDATIVATPDSTHVKLYCN